MDDFSKTLGNKYESLANTYLRFAFIREVIVISLILTIVGALSAMDNDENSKNISYLKTLNKITGTSVESKNWVINLIYFNNRIENDFDIINHVKEGETFLDNKVKWDIKSGS
ncbi:MAG TPA: hypothetical protein VJY62_08140, partial [Bacteroidia bacterium]|nr:hypothetical protein [Bacteroidia bacterium]